MVDAQKTVALTSGDFLILLVRRKKQYQNLAEQTVEYYGIGRVLTVGPTGLCLTYEGWNGQAHDVAAVAPAQTYAVEALAVAADAMWGAWKAREGKPFLTLEAITAFVRDFRLMALSTQKRAP